MCSPSGHPDFCLHVMGPYLFCKLRLTVTVGPAWLKALNHLHDVPSRKIITLRMTDKNESDSSGLLYHKYHWYNIIPGYHVWSFFCWWRIVSNFAKWTGNWLPTWHVPAWLKLDSLKLGHVKLVVNYLSVLQKLKWPLIPPHWNTSGATRQTDSA